MVQNHPQKKTKKSNNSGIQKFAKYSGIAFEMIAIILAFVWAGTKLDNRYNDGDPLFIIIFSISGVFISLYIVLKDFIKPG